MSGLVNYLFFDSIYGVCAIAVATFFLLKKIRKSSYEDNLPFTAALVLFVTGVSILPSIPMYGFEKKVLSGIEKQPWVRVIYKEEVGSLTEPLTWFSSSIGEISIVQPTDFCCDFHLSTLKYNSKQLDLLVEPECKEKLISFSKADSEGIYRGSDKNSNLKMSENEYELYCKQDWTVERKAVINRY
jgi:hypothetical protein|tara:strand:+ start:486 stop:1043 length:558 start_codon:yes stop_codon:yes gene_type:complete